jgi:hypothetical protein
LIQVHAAGQWESQLGLLMSIGHLLVGPIAGLWISSQRKIVLSRVHLGLLSISLCNSWDWWTIALPHVKCKWCETEFHGVETIFKLPTQRSVALGRFGSWNSFKATSRRSYWGFIRVHVMQSRKGNVIVMNLNRSRPCMRVLMIFERSDKYTFFRECWVECAANAMKLLT